MVGWQQRYGGRLYESPQARKNALKERKVEAGVVVLKGRLAHDGTPDAKQSELWLDNLIQPAAAAKLRAELTFSVLSAHMKIISTRQGAFTSILLNSGKHFDQLKESNTPSIRYLYEIESG